MFDLNRKKILITGGGGFIGSNLAKFIEKRFPESEVTIFDKFSDEHDDLETYGSYRNLNFFKGIKIHGDIAVEEDLKKIDKDFDVIFHQAAISNTRIYDEELVFKTNLNSFNFFINKAKNNGTKLIYASSGATYGTLPPPQKVGYERPDNPYGISKLKMDQISLSTIKSTKDAHIVGLRYFNVYGQGESFKKGTSSMIFQLANQLLEGANPKLFFGSDKIYRDFIYINDVMEANLLACIHGNSGIFNVGTGKSRSFKEIADILIKELNLDVEIEYFKNPYEDYQSHTEADISLTQEKLGFTPKFTLEEGIRDYLPFLMKNYESN
jgi:ADP-L-glycero-D-manno-heptose 6-epimerase